MVTIREGGTARRVTAAEAFLLQLTKRGLEGDDAAARASLAVIEEAREQQGGGPPAIGAIVRYVVAPGASRLRLSRYEWPGNSIPTARPREWPSNRGLSRPH